MKKKLRIQIIIQILLFLILVFLDQFTKYLAVIHLKGKDPVSLIDQVLELRYLENSGAAFSLFQNRQWLFYIITAVVLILVFSLWGRVAVSLKKYADLTEDYKKKTFHDGILLNYILMILAAGAVGNLIDRIRFRYVIDFIYFRAIDFPVFNFADICVTISAVLLVVFFLFIYKEDRNFPVLGNKNSKEQ